MRLFKNKLIFGVFIVLACLVFSGIGKIPKEAFSLDNSQGVAVIRTFTLQQATIIQNYSHQRFSSNQSTLWRGQKITKLAVDKPQDNYEPISETVVQSNLEIYNTQAGNRYIPGQCTWYAYNRRVELGLNVGSYWGNAGSWQFNARAGGYRVDNTPSVGAVIEWPGHVAIVERIDTKKNRVYISEMNYLWSFNYHEGWINNADQQVYIH
ncbi:MAG: CHAP domain-containing protein [Bifidobacteriaceae bacterium]|jgi:surface antigen|nr:CHAP domain-containing protein [Bifidobacteriaceae bacterium]